MFGSDEAIVAELARTAAGEHDPLWPMPLWAAYDEDLGSKIADLNNISSTPFAGAIYGQNPSYANERFPTEIRATAAAFCYHICAAAGGFVPPVLAYFAVERHMGFALPMLIGTLGGLVSFVVTLFFSPETKGKAMVADLQILPAE